MEAAFVVQDQTIWMFGSELGAVDLGRVAGPGGAVDDDDGLDVRRAFGEGSLKVLATHRRSEGTVGRLRGEEMFLILEGTHDRRGTVGEHVGNYVWGDDAVRVAGTGFPAGPEEKDVGSATESDEPLAADRLELANVSAQSAHLVRLQMTTKSLLGRRHSKLCFFPSCSCSGLVPTLGVLPASTIPPRRTRHLPSALQDLQRRDDGLHRRIAQDRVGGRPSTVDIAHCLRHLDERRVHSHFLQLPSPIPAILPAVKIANSPSRLVLLVDVVVLLVPTPRFVSFVSSKAAGHLSF